MGCRDPGGMKCAGTWTASAAGVMALSESFSSLWKLAIRRPFWLVFLIAPPIQAFKEASWLGCFSVVPHVRCLKGQPLYCSAAGVDMWKRGAIVMAPVLTHDSAVLPCFHGFLAFLHRHFSCPLGLSQQSTAALTLKLLHNPYAPAPSCCTF